VTSISLLLVSTLALCVTAIHEHRKDFNREAENPALSRLALRGMINPEHIPEVRARRNALADGGSISAFLERSGLNDYAKVIETDELDPFPLRERRSPGCSQPQMETGLSSFRAELVSMWAVVIRGALSPRSMIRGCRSSAVTERLRIVAGTVLL